MKIETPEVFVGEYDKPSVFLAGGITGCPLWQEEACDMIKEAGADILVFNPRRENFPMDNPNAAKVQIEWEFNHLRIAHRILFWFPCETLCPIVLYELGTWSVMAKPISVGVHPDYRRRQDVEVQTSLIRPNVKIKYTLLETVEDVIRGL